jgi:hypothetical protein
MYPDTDLPPITIQDELLDQIAAQVPEAPWQREQQLLDCGVGADLAERLARHPSYSLFGQLAGRLDGCGGLSATGLASLLLDRACPCPADPEAGRRWWERAIERIAAGEILPEALYGGAGEPPRALPESEGRTLFARLVRQVPPDGPGTSPQREHFAMAHIMPALRGRMPGRLVWQWVREALR